MKSSNESLRPVRLAADPTSERKFALRIFWSLLGTFMLVGALAPVPAAAAVSTGSQYTAVTPVRLMDTRSVGGPLGSTGSRNLIVAGGTTGVPVGATAVVLNVTVTGTTAASFLTVYPTGTARPTASNLNWVAGKTIPNLVEVMVGSGGQVTFYNQAGSTHVIADLQGYFAAPSGTAGEQRALTPARITDTRNGSGFANAGSHLGAGGTLNIQVTGAGLVPGSGVSAAILNVTVTNTSAASFLTVWPTGAVRPTASNLNWTKGVTIPNRVIVRVGTGGMVTVYNQFGSVDVIVDVSGYFTDGTAAGAQFTPQSPTRIADTRGSAQTLGAGGTFTLQVGGVGAVPGNATAVIVNVTVTNTTAASFLTVYPSTASRPTASDLNWVRGVTIPNLTVATLGATGAIRFYNSAGQADVVVDLVGYFAVAGAPTITSIVPSFGPSAGGTAVDINGTNFQVGAVVTFNACTGAGGTDTAVQSAAFVSSTVLHIAATTVNPRGSDVQSSCNVNVTNPDSGAVNMPAGWTYNVPTPTITSLVPNNGTGAGSTAVDVNGTNFQAGAVVTFNACTGTGGTDTAAQTTTFVSSVLLHIASSTANPRGPTGSSVCNVNVLNPDTGTGNLPGGWTYNAVSMPTIISVVPSFGSSAGGTAVDVNGTNFQSGAVVTFNSCFGGSGGTDSAAQATTFVSATQLHIASTTANPHGATVQSTCNVNVTNPDLGTTNLASGWTYNGTPPDLVSVAISVGTKDIVATWSQAVDCPAASAAQFTFADNYTGPGKASGGTAAVAANVASGTASTDCTITFGTEVANFGTNDYGTFTYTQPASPTTGNAVNNSNGFAPSASMAAADVSAPLLTGVGAVTGSQVLQVVYSEPVLCSTVTVADYSATLNTAPDAVTIAACDGGFGGSSRLVDVTLTTAPSSTGDNVGLASHGVMDQYGNLEPGTQSGTATVYSAQMHLIGITATQTSIDGGVGTITLTLSSSVDCATVAADGSDYTVTDDTSGAGTITLTSVASCSTNTIVYNYTAGPGGVFSGDFLTATAQDGVDGDTVLNSTDNQWELVGDSFGTLI